MKRVSSILFVIFFACICGCLNKNLKQPNLSHKKTSAICNFKAEDIDKLSLDIMNFYVKDNSLKHDSNYITAAFNNHPDFLGGKSLLAHNKNIDIAVFKSKKSAIQAMETHIRSVAAMILLGEKNKYFNGKWWYCFNSFADCIYANEGNVIISVSFNHPKQKDIGNILFDTTTEIISKIRNIKNASCKNMNE